MARRGGGLPPLTNDVDCKILHTPALRSISSSLSNHLHPLRLSNGSPSHFGREVVGIDMAEAAALASSPQFIRDVRDALCYEHGVLVFRGQCHLTPRDEVRALPSKLFSHQPEDNDENQDQQSYTGGAGTQHRLPQYPSVALVGELSCQQLPWSDGRIQGSLPQLTWHPDQRAWHCDGITRDQLDLENVNFCRIVDAVTAGLSVCTVF